MPSPVPAKVIASPSAWLEVISPHQPHRRISLNTGRVSIGRGAEANVPLEGPAVSRHHAVIVRDPFERYWLHDLGSRNGTDVNGAAVSTQLLRDADVITIGPHTLKLRMAHAAAAIQPHTGANLGVSNAPGLHITTMGEIGSPKLAVEHLRELSRFSSRLIQLADPKLRLESLCSLMLASQFHGQTGMAVRIAMDAAEHPQILCIRRAPGLPEQAPYISRSLLQAAIKHRQPLLAGNAGPAPLDVKLSVSPEVMPISVLACPIEISSENLDLLTVTMPPEFGTPEWLALAALAVEQFQHAETAWAMRKEAERHAAIDRELEHARAIQQQYLPRDLHVAGLDLAIEFRPSLWVGGDYVDVVPTPDGRVLLSIADVSGKGLHAALVASSLHAVLHVLAATQPDLPRLMREANGYLCRTLEMRSFVTMLCMLLDPQTGDFHCVNAGHPPALMLERGKFTALQSGVNMPLGIQSADYEAQRGCLARGQALAMFTDGLTELRNERDELLGIDHLGGCLASLHEPDLSAGEITRRLRTQLDEYQCSSLPVDDQTLLLTRRL